MTAAAIDPERVGAFAGRLFGAATASLELATIHLGDRLGLYRALAERGPLTTAELAEATATNERYVREWARAQAVCGILEAGDGRYGLPPEHAEALVNRESPAYLVPLAAMNANGALLMPDLLDAFRDGGGVGYERYGAGFRDAAQDLVRPLYLHNLGGWIAALPDAHERLLAGGRAVDVGCGAGLAAVELAKRYPAARVEGVDLDTASIDLARENARAAGADVRFHVRDASDPGLDGPYDLITLFESLHHFARPLEALRRLRALLAPGGTLLVAEYRTDGEFERFTHLISVVHCLPTAMAEAPSAAMGAVVEPETVLAMAAEAGFAEAAVAPIEHEMLRFFALR
jgi:2-polyprenyl-3-methyl-5-hydroxy-6-metoxy-1,4-benzoquinol methylase